MRAAVSEVNSDQMPANCLDVTFNESCCQITGDADMAGKRLSRFYAPMSWGGMVSDYRNSYLGRGFPDVEPMNGRMVIFPSFLLHSALPCRGDTDRKSP